MLFITIVGLRNRLSTGPQTAHKALMEQKGLDEFSKAEHPVRVQPDFVVFCAGFDGLEPDFAKGAGAVAAGAACA